MPTCPWCLRPSGGLLTPYGPVNWCPWCQRAWPDRIHAVLHFRTLRERQYQRTLVALRNALEFEVITGEEFRHRRSVIILRRNHNRARLEAMCQGSASDSR